MPDQDQNSRTGTVNSLVYNNVLSLTQAGTSTQYVLHPDAFILRNGVKVAASDLQIGDVVKARIYNNTVVFVEVTSLGQVNQAFDIQGTLNGTTVNSQGKITTISIIQNINGNNQTAIYNVSPDVALTGNLGSFTQGHLIQLKGQNQVVTQIDVK
ncbi:hypothetical protein [Paenibacillus sp. N3.4]|uniref:hypothetical protein n=1 Tax=Paenibacillus sp. N3.4 TaxID=2603222 RepID=UPI0021C37716|nr:hypothetical protein [Paenibacillus sp. N3.4]